MQPLLDLPQQTLSEEIDEEILDIFVDEAKEVMEEIASSFKDWKDNPEDGESLKTLRRNFHTLKGSGRLVGAMVIGELGWKFENLLNRVIDGSIPRGDAIFSLVGKVETVLPDMVEQFREQKPTPYEVALLISQAHHLTETKGQSLGEFELPKESSDISSKITASEATKSAAKSVAASTSTPKVAPPPAKSKPSEEEEEEELMAKAMASLVEEMESSGPDLKSIPTNDRAQANEENRVSSAELALEEEQINFEELSTPGEEIQLEETLTTDDLQFGELEEDLSLPDFAALDDIQLSDLSAPETSLSDHDDSTSLSAMVNELEALPVEFESMATSTASKLEDFDAGLDLAAPLPADDLSTAEGENAVDAKLLAVFKKEASQHLAHLKDFLSHCDGAAPVKLDAEIMRTFHTLHGSSLSVGYSKISDLASPLENYVKALVERQMELASDKLSLLQKAVDLIERHLDVEGRPVEEDEQQTLIDNVQLALESLPMLPKIVSKPPVVSTPPVTAVPDASDEFMSIFLDEAEEILENTQSLLERWQAAPHNMQLMKELQRELHTLKGGSRMVGISAMGDLSHSLESVLTKIVEGGAQSNAKLQEIVQNSVDELAAMLEAVRSGVPLEMPTDLITQINSALQVDAEDQEVLPAKAATTASRTAAAAASPPATLPVESKKPPAPAEDVEPLKMDKMAEKDADLVGEGGEDRIRVRVALIDKLTNLAGELSISRAHLEQQQGAVKNNLGEMEQTVARLRDQLRRLEIETEAQILSHFHGVPHHQTKPPAQSQPPDHQAAHKEEFDPLELDRFSVMQQLSRSLMETINDLLNIQEAMKVLTRQTETLLIQQTRMGAELQDAIMRTRMIPFSRISPRLQRIARLTARELRKQVDFIINGENIEFERTVLNRIVAPLEHMLRNAIGHGIEDAATRQQAGKAAMAKITIDIGKEGSELILKISDDGAGLDLLAIRKKAEERGMIKPDTVISDYELMQFILEPAFSTAKVVTQISGRGVGMDVVNSEIKQLNGSLHIHSKTGVGTLFEIRLPLSLTINQALLVHVGEETMAIPMNNVDAVMRATRTEVLGEGETRNYKYMGNDYRVYQLSELLGFGKLTSDRPLIPTLLVRAADRRVALLVDNIEGSKEIVVKSVGPQIGAIRWIAGATILGDGRVVLILDVPTLTRADKELHYIPPQQAAPEVIEKPAAKTIMVVDDSITVRKVTARLLKRQGMEVLTAKDGVDAVAQLQEHVPDLMLLDVEMPRMDGYELATQIRNTIEWKHIPIIMITSRTGAKHRDRAEKIGIDRYLGKPFNETELLENINALLTERAGASS